MDRFSGFDFAQYYYPLYFFPIGIVIVFLLRLVRKIRIISDSLNGLINSLILVLMSILVLTPFQLISIYDSYYQYPQYTIVNVAQEGWYISVVGAFLVTLIFIIGIELKERKSFDSLSEKNQRRKISIGMLRGQIRHPRITLMLTLISIGGFAMLLIGYFSDWVIVDAQSWGKLVQTWHINGYDVTQGINLEYINFRLPELFFSVFGIAIAEILFLISLLMENSWGNRIRRIGLVMIALGAFSPLSWSFFTGMTWLGMDYTLFFHFQAGWLYCMTGGLIMFIIYFVKKRLQELP